MGPPLLALHPPTRPQLTVSLQLRAPRQGPKAGPRGRAPRPGPRQGPKAGPQGRAPGRAPRQGPKAGPQGQGPEAGPQGRAPGRAPRQGPKAGPRGRAQGRAQRQGPKAGPQGRAPRQGPRAGPRGRAPRQGPKAGPRGRAPRQGPKAGPQGRAPRQGPKAGPQGRARGRGPEAGPPRQGPKAGPQGRAPRQGHKAGPKGRAPRQGLLFMKGPVLPLVKQEILFHVLSLKCGDVCVMIRCAATAWAGTLQAVPSRGKSHWALIILGAYQALLVLFLVLWVQGGAWCSTLKTCAQRASTPLGSTRYWPEPEDPRFRVHCKASKDAFSSLSSAAGKRTPGVGCADQWALCPCAL